MFKKLIKTFSIKLCSYYPEVYTLNYKLCSYYPEVALFPQLQIFLLRLIIYQLFSTIWSCPKLISCNYHIKTRNSKFANECMYRSSHWKCFITKGVLKIYNKTPVQSLFLNKVAGLLVFVV